jgi:hypothetical protein
MLIQGPNRNLVLDGSIHPHNYEGNTLYSFADISNANTLRGKSERNLPLNSLNLYQSASRWRSEGLINQSEEDGVSPLQV